MYPLNTQPRYLVVINHEAQHSIWPAYKTVPRGWMETAFSGDKATCLAHIEESWHDQREASLQEWLAHSPSRT